MGLDEWARSKSHLASRLLSSYLAGSIDLIDLSDKKRALIVLDDLYFQEDQPAIFNEQNMPIADIRVDRSWEYELSFEPSYTGTSGVIAVQEFLIRTLLGIDEVIIVIAGLIGIIATTLLTNHFKQ